MVSCEYLLCTNTLCDDVRPMEEPPHQQLHTCASEDGTRLKGRAGFSWILCLNCTCELIGRNERLVRYLRQPRDEPVRWFLHMALAL